MYQFPLKEYRQRATHHHCLVIQRPATTQTIAFEIRVHSDRLEDARRLRVHYPGIQADNLGWKRKNNDSLNISEYGGQDGGSTWKNCTRRPRGAEAFGASDLNRCTSLISIINSPRKQPEIRNHRRLFIPISRLFIVAPDIRGSILIPGQQAARLILFWSLCSVRNSSVPTQNPKGRLQFQARLNQRHDQPTLSLWAVCLMMSKLLLARTARVLQYKAFSRSGFAC